MNKLTLLALTVGLVGCGKISGQALPDAAKQFADAHEDAAPDANLTGTLRAITQTHVTGQGALAANLPGVQLISLRPNDSMVDMQTTDATASASLQIYPGGSVTAVYPHVYDNGGTAAEQGADLVTFMGVQDGDALTFGTRYAPYMGGSNATSDGTVTVNSEEIGATEGYLEVYTPCGYFEQEFTSQAQALSIPVYPWCNISPWAIGGNVYEISPTVGEHYVYEDTDLTSNSSSMYTYPYTLQNTTMSVTGLPAEVTSASLQMLPVMNPQIFYNDANYNYDSEASTGGAPVGGAFSGSSSVYPIGDHFLGTLEVSRAGNFSQTNLYDQLPTNTSTWAVSAPALPGWLNGTALFSGEKRIEWNVDSTTGASTYDATVVSINWQHPTMISGASVSIPYTWTFILPPDARTLTFPTLPAAFAAQQPDPAVDAISYEVRLVEFPSVSGYDALRAVPERNIVDPQSAVRVGEMSRAIVND